MAKKRRKPRGTRGGRRSDNRKSKNGKWSQPASADSDDPDKYDPRVEWALQLKRLRNQYCDVAKLLQKGVLPPLGICCVPKDMVQDVAEFRGELESAQPGLKLAYKSYKELTGFSHAELMRQLVKTGSWPPVSGATPFLTNQAARALAEFFGQKIG